MSFRLGRCYSRLLSAVILAIMISFTGFSGTIISAEASETWVVPFTSALDYSDSSNWCYDGVGDHEVDVFIVGPTVDTLNPANSVMTAEYKKRLRYALNSQQSLYAETARLYSPFYRQGSIKCYELTNGGQEMALDNAYVDISAAFEYYLDHKNGGRPIILAGFSQGADMVYRLMQEYYGGDGDRAVNLRKNLVAAYAIGWAMTEDMVSAYPQIVPAKGETDTGVVISYDCEDGTVDGTITLPAGVKAISINPLNWKTDSTPADKSLNLGVVEQNAKTGAIESVTPGLYGAYIDPQRGALVVTDVDMSQYPPVLSIFPQGSLHLQDNFFFYVNLQENIKKRTAAFLANR